MTKLNMTKFSATAKPSSEVYRKNYFGFILLKIARSGYEVEMFLVHMKRDAEEGVYKLYFLNCHGLNETVESSSIDLKVNLVEHNVGNFLSAGEIPIPLLYFVSTAVFLTATLLWAVVLHIYKKDVLKIHYLMLSVVVFTALARFFHAVNMYYIGKEGLHKEAWAVLYYIATLFQETLFFITILLLGAGIGFIKHVLSCREKILSAIVIPIQVLDSLAIVLVEDCEEGQSYYEMWSVIAFFVYLICWTVILSPLVWSVRLCQQESSTTKLFRPFCLMIIYYVYLTRIVVILLKMKAPFCYEWLSDLFKEITTAVFFVLTGYKFHPAPYNLYLQVPQESDDIKMNEVITKTGYTDAVKRVNGQKENSD